MENHLFKLERLLVEPLAVSLYVPPIVWKGDSVGHIGSNDYFFWVLEGECFLSIDSQSYIVKPGQLAYLPKGKMRAYTHASERFSMYEMSFAAKANDEDLMEVLGLCDSNFVVDIPNKEEMNYLFENSHRKEMHKNPLHDVGWCANIVNIIQTYAKERQKQSGNDSHIFKPVLEYMTNNIANPMRAEQLAALVYMQPSYFIKSFRKTYNMPPMAYLNRMRVYKAMGLLAGTDLSMDEIAHSVGISDKSYFSRMFKKHCNVTPSEYRNELKKF